ncbi:MAG: TetR-like C-terminal domain-containing protein [Pseudonocardiales bacterium]
MCSAAERSPGRFVLIATALWANVHGLVSLELGGAIPTQAGAPVEVFEAAIRANLDGWRANR